MKNRERIEIKIEIEGETSSQEVLLVTTKMNFTY